LRSFFFVALDEHDMSVKRMQSFTTVQPGETTGCVGCHEDRLQAPPHSLTQPAATRRDPSRITPVADVPDVFDFPRDIQPILDRNCLPCHDYNRRAGKTILSGDRGPIYSHSYYTLTIHNHVFAEIEKRRCGSCHNANSMPLPASASDDQKLPPWDPLKKVDYRRQFSRHLLFNLTRTDLSMLLLAPLSQGAGGYGLCKAAVFSSTSDSDYVGLLAYIDDAKHYLDQVKRFDMLGFQPREAWVREMKRFGIPLASPIDYYAAEREYWKSLWYKPQ